MVSDSPGSSRQPVSRPPLAAASTAADVEFNDSFEVSKEEIENQRLDREEALRVSCMQLSSRSLLSLFACVFLFAN
jgi:hypothetical protein